IAIFAVLKAGAVFVPINPSAKLEKLKYILANCRASALICEVAPNKPLEMPWLRLVVTRKDQRKTAFPVLDFDSIQREWPNNRPGVGKKAEDLACLIYTSGSTGQPKGVMCEHRNMVFASGSIIRYLENTDSDIVLGVLPLSFDYGLYQLLMTFRFGGTL